MIPLTHIPWLIFCESEEALGGILTNIAIVLPEKIYLTAEWLRKKQLQENESGELIIDNALVEKFNSFGNFTPYEINLCKFIHKFSLAR